MQEIVDHYPWTRSIACHAAGRALPASLRRALATLGYRVLGATELAGEAGAGGPDLLLVDARGLAMLPPDLSAPLVLIAGRRTGQCDDPRIVARLQRPVRLKPLYAACQRALEAHPRSVPRIPARLPARSLRGEEQWPGVILSISEGGCLFRSQRETAVGARIELQFALPALGLFDARARCAYARGAEAGLVFQHAARATRARIEEFVDLRLGSAPPAP